jgi:hypothetical protein
VPPWPPLPPPASSIFRVCSRPTDCPGTSTRTPCSPSSRLLSWPGRQFAGAGATAAAAALRRRTPTPAWSSAQPKFQTGAHRVVERPTATSCLGRCANSPEQAYPRPSPDAAVELARRYCLRRNSSRQCIRSEPLAVILHLPDLLRRRSCRIPARIAAGWSQGPNCLTNFLSRGPCAKLIFHSLCVVAAPCKIHNKSQKNPKTGSLDMIF